MVTEKTRATKLFLGWVITTFCLVSIVAGFARTVNGDELAGRVLIPVDQMESAVEAGVGALLVEDRDKVRGSINEVKVTESTERATTIEISYTGFEHAEFRGEVLDSDKRVIRAIKKARFSTPEGDATAQRTTRIRFELKAGTDEGFEVQSSRVKFRISKAGHRTAQFVNVYALDKRWALELSPENVVVRVRPEPIGNTGAWVRRISSRPPRATPAGGLRIHGGVRPASTLPSHLRTATLSDSTRAALLSSETLRVAPVAVAKPQTTTSNTLKISAAKTVSTKNRSVIAKLPQARHRITVADYKFAKVKPAATPESTEPTNQVAASYVNLLGQLTTEDVEIQPSEILGVFSQVYPDTNANSGTFYYIPRSYRLSYNTDIGGARGLGFRISYDRRREGDETATVRMAASFDSAVDLNEIKLAEKILQSIDRQDSSFSFKPPLRAFPLAAPPEFDFSGTLAGLVESDQIAVIALSDTLEGIDVSWATDPVDAQNIRRDLRDGIPISGLAAFDAPNSDAPVLVVPARVELTDPEVYRALTWSRTEEIRNSSPLPVILKNVHALVIESNKPRLYSWDLANTVVPPQAHLELDLTNVPPQVDSKAERVWIQYTLDRRCEECIDRVIEEILSGSLWPDLGTLTIRTLTPLEMTGAAEIWADVRSRFFDPSDRTPLDGPRQFMTQDRAEYTIDPIFLTNRMPPDGSEEWPLFEYRLTVVMPDGAIHEGSAWVSSGSETIVIGPVQIEQSLGFVPGME